MPKNQWVAERCCFRECDDMTAFVQDFKQRANVDLALQRPEATDHGACRRREACQKDSAKTHPKRGVAALPAGQGGSARGALCFIEVRKKSQRVRSRRSRWNVILPRPA